MLAGAVVLNLATFPPPWMAALPGLGFREAMAMTQASTALSIVSPAAQRSAWRASYSMLRSWRFRSAAVALAVAITGIWNQLVNLAFPVVALALLTAQDEDHPALRTAALIGVAVLVVAVTGFALVLSRAEWAQRIGDLAARLANRALRSCGAARSSGEESRSCASAPRRSDSSAAAGTSSRSRRSPVTSRSSCCSSSASASPA